MDAAYADAAARVRQLARTLGARLIETHISWVLLLPQFAYKLKKPLRLPFLDYSTPALRRHFCEGEVRLNQRLAPSVYLGVSRVTGSLANPASIFMSVAASLKALAIARAVALHNLPELIPVDLSVIVVLGIGIQFQFGVGKREPHCFRLRNCEIDEALTKLVVRLSLHAPSHQFRGVRRICVARAEHHE